MFYRLNALSLTESKHRETKINKFEEKTDKNVISLMPVNAIALQHIFTMLIQSYIEKTVTNLSQQCMKV